MVTKNSIIKIFLLLCIIFTTESFAQKRIALVIGNSDYQVRPLQNPINDARDISVTLRGLGFDVDLKVNANQEDMEAAVKKFGKKLQGNTVGLFYYSGHGIQYKGDNYLIPIGAMSRVSAPEHLRYKTVGTGYVLGVMKQAGNGLNIVVLDACRTNPFKSFSRSMSKGLTRISGVEGTLIAYATSPGKVAWDGRGRNSPYTENLIKLMRKSNLPVELMFKQVRRKVKQQTGGKQSPWYEASIDGDFYFNNQQLSGDIQTESHAIITNYPKVQVVNYSNGDRYEGEFAGDKRHGQGVYTDSDGNRYDGMWKDDKRNGQGVATFANGVRYDGMWKDDKRNGQGVFTFANGGRYDGMWKDGSRNGQGVLTSANGNRYDGMWKDNKKHGQGVHTYAYGARYDGMWKDGEFVE